MQEILSQSCKKYFWWVKIHVLCVCSGEIWYLFHIHSNTILFGTGNKVLRWVVPHWVSSKTENYCWLQEKTSMWLNYAWQVVQKQLWWMAMTQQSTNQQTTIDFQSWVLAVFLCFCERIIVWQNKNLYYMICAKIPLFRLQSGWNIISHPVDMKEVKSCNYVGKWPMEDKLWENVSYFFLTPNFLPT